MLAYRKGRKKVETLVHGEAKRTNIPTAEYSSAMEDDGGDRFRRESIGAQWRRWVRRIPTAGLWRN